MPDHTDPHAVADDPSGIVQQMPEGGDGLAPCPFCGAKAPKVWLNEMTGEVNSVECKTCFAEVDDIPSWNRRATEADLRAEVERLKYALAQAAVPLEGLTLAAHMTESDMGLCKGAWNEINNAVAHIRAALSPETDGGQDG